MNKLKQNWTLRMPPQIEKQRKTLPTSPYSSDKSLLTYMAPLHPRICKTIGESSDLSLLGKNTETVRNMTSSTYGDGARTEYGNEVLKRVKLVLSTPAGPDKDVAVKSLYAIAPVSCGGPKGHVPIRDGGPSRLKARLDQIN